MIQPFPVVGLGAADGAARAGHPQVLPSLFCFSHLSSGPENYSNAPASALSLPVSSFSVACQGWLEPFSSIAQNF